MGKPALENITIEQIGIGDMARIAKAGESIGAVRDVRRNEPVISAENAGAFDVPLAAVITCG